jgi:hypothetical protein
MTMIEQVAGALAKLDTTDEGEHHQLCITSYADIARVCIEAMREPTTEMVDATIAAYQQKAGSLDYDEVWRIMIDAALQEP